MRRRGLVAVALVAGVSLQVAGLPQVAHADATTRYVDQNNANCTNVGTGTQAAPYCTIQAAASAAQPGDTVIVAAGTYNENVTINHSGVAGAPITFKPALGATVTVGGGQLHGFAIMGSTTNTISYITISGFTVSGTTNYGIYLKYNSNIVLTNNHVTLSGQPVSGSAEQGIYVLGTTDSLIANNTTDHNSDSGIYLTTGTTNVTVQGNTSFSNARQYTRAAVGIDVRSPGNFVYNNLTYNNEDSGIQIYNGGNNTVVANNISYNNGDHGIDCLNSTGVTEVANTVYGNATAGINFEGAAGSTASQGATVRNNISVDNGANSTSTKGNIRVDANSTTGTTLDYDLVYEHTAGAVTLTWGTKTYTTIGAFTTASGQETNGFGNNDPMFEGASSGDFNLTEGSVAIDSANANAPNEPTTDFAGNARVDDPQTTNIGVGPPTYYDRGALEYQPIKPPKANLSITPSSGPAPLSVTADASGSTDADGTISTYTFDFGDGTAKVGPQAGATANHVYQTAGTYTAKVTVTDNTGLSSSTSVIVNVAPPVNPITVAVAASPSAGAAPLQVTADASGSKDNKGNTITSYKFDFGDGSAAVGPQSGATATHTYNAVGTYTITVTATDSGGLSSTGTAKVVVGNATVDEVHYTYLTPTSVSFDWRGGPSTIKYGPTTSYGTTVTAVTPNPLPWSSDGPYWQATLTGLQANTTYHYSIGGSADQTFSTEPTGNFRFDVEGDVGDSTTYPAVGPTQSQIASDHPAFVLNTGDISYADVGEPQVVDQAFNDSTAWSLNAAYMPAWGNHDWEGPGDDLRNYKGRFDLPNSQASVGAPSIGGTGDDWGWFDAGGVRFISYPEPYTSSTWTEWQQNAASIFSAAQANPAINYIVTYGHRPAYSTGHHPGDPKLAAILNSFGDTYSKYVLNFNGHSHDYERFLPIHGVVNITAAGGGATLEGPWTSTDPNTAFRAMHFAHEMIDVTPTEMVVNAICGPPSSQDDTSCTQGTILDSVTIVNPKLANSPPTANLKVNPSSGPAPLGVTADASGSTNGGAPISTYAFNWGDGATTPAQSSPQATHGFTAAGTYTVTVTVTDTAGRTATASAQVSVSQQTSTKPPTAVLAVNPTSGTAPVAVTADATGSKANDPGSCFLLFCTKPATISSYKFNFGDGSATITTTSTKTATHTYTTPGNYTVTLTVTDSNGAVATATATESVVAPIPPPTANLTLTPTSGMAPLNVSADGSGSVDNAGNSITSYTFNFGDGSSPVTQSTAVATHQYTAAGTFTVTLTVTGTAGKTATTTQSVTVNPPDSPPVAALTVSPTTGAAPLPITADATNSTDNDTYPIASYKFDFGDGGSVGPQAAGTAQHTYAAAGTYNVTVTVTDTAGMSSRAATTVTVGPAHGTNAIGNPGFETNTTGWNTSGRTGITLTQVAGGNSGSYAAALTNTTTTTAADCTLNDSPDWVKSTFSGTYTASLWVRADNPGAKLNLRIREYQGSTSQGSKTVSVTLTTSWQQVSMTYTPTISTGGEDLDFTAYITNAAPGNCFYADDAVESLN